MDVEPWTYQRGKIPKSNLIFEIFHMYKTCTMSVQCLYKSHERCSFNHFHS
jgi:hypothetical protein